MTLREGPSKSRWTWRARFMLLLLLAFPVLTGLWVGLILGAFTYVLERYFYENSNELSVFLSVGFAIVIFVVFSIGMALDMVFKYPKFLRHYGMTMREYCHLPRKETHKLWDEYKR